MAPNDVRIGFGYDVHRFTRGRKLRLGGVTIPHNMGLAGHSDADVLLHAICDAVLGAAAMGDIGRHFPDTDTKYKGIASLRLLREVRNIVRRNSFAVVNVDSTVVLEAPKIAPHAEKMRRNISRALGIEEDRVSVKASTNETLGFVGRGEGCAAFAVVSLRQTI
ncbi:MAG: 2-C-methyl-D-erythritol 2,4-cyclodiphosphate synthase [Ignavibacteria bacterium]|nr:2-C-methyl-D-erythritol 2,4-cyclodiphosphate synthase [Ignavibacteria bacterium]